MKRLLSILLFVCLPVLGQNITSQDVEPRMVKCPIDGHWASFTGKQRQDPKQGLECQYLHVWIHSNQSGDSLLDEKHEFWAPCQNVDPGKENHK